MTPTNKVKPSGFTRTELLTVIAVIGILALTQLAGFARHGQVAQAALCQNNLAQLQSAWLLYVDDSNGQLPASTPNSSLAPEWVGTRNANADDLNVSVTNSPLWNYSAKSLDHWRCPADPVRIVTSNPKQTHRRVRTYSMNIYMRDYSIFSESGWRTFINIHDFNALAPQDAFLLIDEHPGSVNDAAFTMNMNGYPNEPDKWRLIDMPGSNHAEGAGVAFVDGHVELKRWVDNRTKAPYMAGKFLSLNLAQPGNMDILWIQERSTRKLAP